MFIFKAAAIWVNSAVFGAQMATALLKAIFTRRTTHMNNLLLEDQRELAKLEDRSPHD